LYLESLEEQFELDFDIEFDTGLTGEIENPKFVKYIIPNAQREKLLKELDLLGVNDYSVFPDLEGLAKTINKNLE